jgi:hypothetical protein
VNGSCSDGNVGHTCFEDDDCNATAPYCVTAVPGSAGYCNVGELGDECFDDADCQSSYCRNQRCDEI